MKISDELFGELIAAVEEDLELCDLCENCMDQGNAYAYIPKKDYKKLKAYFEKRLSEATP